MDRDKPATAPGRAKPQKKLQPPPEDFHQWFGPKSPEASPLDAMHILLLKEQVKKLETQNKTLKWLVHFLNDHPQAASALRQEQAPEPEIPVETHAQEFPNVTKREMEILRLLAEGLCAKEIAGQLYISETTVITHKKNLKDKFKVKNTAQLISKANAMLKS
jgi:DNA-binding CsgD family transcriptional regulator